MVASFREAKPQKPYAKGPIAADELADRIALVPAWAVADREHVRDAEHALGWTEKDALDDPQRLTALGRRLQADLVIGALLDGDTAHLVLVEPQAGKVDKLDAKGKGPRPDLVAAQAARLLVERDHAEVPGLSRAALDAVDGAGSDKAYEAYAVGREKLYAKDVPGALAQLESAVMLDGKLGRAQALLAYARLKARDYAGASPPAKAGAEAQPALRETRLQQARVEDYLEHADAAIDAYKNVLGAAPNDAVAHSNLGRLYAAKKRDHLQAAREYAAATAAEPAWWLPALNLAVENLQLGRALKAVETLERLHQDDPGSFDVSVTLARAYRKADRASAAVTLLRPLVAEAAHAGDALARAELALDEAEAGRADDAKKTLDGAPNREAVALEVARARVLLGLHDPKGAIALLEAGRDKLSSEKSALDRHEYQKTLAVALLEAGRAADAARALREVTDEDPLEAEAQYDLGLALSAQKDPQAAASFEKAAAAAPWLVPAVLADAQAKLAAGDGKAAARVLERAASTEGAGVSDGRLHLYLGLARWREGKLDDAIAELQRASDTLADGALQAEAAYDLAEALLAARRRQDARVVAGKYLTLEKRPGQEARILRARAIAH